MAKSRLPWLNRKRALGSLPYNAKPELLPEARARHERTLEAVSSRPWFGEHLRRLSSIMLPLGHDNPVDIWVR